MPTSMRQAALERLLDMPDVRTWWVVHEHEIAVFERHLRSIDPLNWQEEFVRLVLQSVEQEEQD